VLDAYRYVKAAQTWNLVKPQARMVSHTIQLNNGTFANDTYHGGQVIGPDGVQSTMTVTSESLVQNNFDTLEHVNVRVWISHTTRGEVEVEIVSPNGIKSVLAGPRDLDKAGSGYPGWKFMSIKHWLARSFLILLFRVNSSI
jgi:kexin